MNEHPPSADSQPTPPPLDLDSIRKRCEAATVGPWKLWNGYGPLHDGRMRVLRIGPDDPHAWKGLQTTPDSEDINGERADFEFIAHAREDIPALLAEVDALRTRLSARSEQPNIHESHSRDGVLPPAHPGLGLGEASRGRNTESDAHAPSVRAPKDVAGSEPADSHSISARHEQGEQESVPVKPMRPWHNTKYAGEGIGSSGPFRVVIRTDRKTEERYIEVLHDDDAGGFGFTRRQAMGLIPLLTKAVEKLSPAHLRAEMPATDSGVKE